MTSYLKSLWDGYLGLALPIRLLIGAAISGLGGSGLVGFLSEYAAYSFAVSYGIRPPLEGIPYLRVAVTTMTLGVFIGGATLSLLIVLVARLLIFQGVRLVGTVFAYVNLFSRLFPGVAYSLARMKDNSLDRLKAKGMTGPEEFIKMCRDSISWQVAITIALGIFFLVAALITGVKYLQTREEYEAILAGIGIGGVVSLMVLLLWSPRLVSWFAILGTAAFFVLAPFSLFHAPTYANLLRVLGYGGGVPVRANVLNGNGEVISAVEGFLVLRTTTSLILFDDKHDQVVEMPLTKVGTLGHAVGTLQSDKWKLPHFRGDAGNEVGTHQR